MDVPLPLLEREVARAAAASAAARAALARGDLEGPSPLARMRDASSRATYLDLCDSPDPLAATLRPWVAALTLDRVLYVDEVRLAAAWRAPSIIVEEPGLGRFVASPRDLLHRVLADPEPRRRPILADALARGAAPVADAARHLAERRAEAARLLGVDLDALEIPIDPPAALASSAAALLVETAPYLVPAERWDGALAAALGREATEGWPARLSSRWLFDLFGRSRLTEGLRIAPAALPPALGAASFARALASFGAALAEVDGPRAAPFALARAPFDLRVQRRAALFATLAADPVFFARAFDLGRARARDQARVVARALLASIRLDAARVLLRGLLVRPERERRAVFEDETARALGVSFPASLAGVIPRLGPADPSRLAGELLALGDRRVLIEQSDEDWWRNPHAAELVRAEDVEIPRPRAPAEALSRGITELVRLLRDLG
jgi:hypothetical protein